VSPRDEHREFVRSHFGLEATSFDPIGEGWAYDTYLVDGEWVFQFPRLPGEDETLRKQLALLPDLAVEVSTRVPVPTYASTEPPCMGYRRIEGAPFPEVGDEGIWPERLGRFLYDVHMVPPEFVGMRARPVDAVRGDLRAQLADWTGRVVPLLEPDERRRSLDLFEAYAEDDAIWHLSTCLTHGDLGPEHILVTRAGDLAGVIDWGDASVGDPVWDFAWLLRAVSLVGERALAAYGGEPDQHFRDRARFAFALMPWHEVAYGLDTGQPAFVESGLRGVRSRLP
jgi:aminoglycoside phosphotransferase (APT) family kinase protein